jgi:tRNA(Ile)-lysidine synthase
MEDLRQRVYRFIQKEGLAPDQTGEKGRKVLVGVSGGPDSVCLLHILDQLKDSLGVRLHVAHLNHMLRGVESDADASYVNALSDSMGIPATIGKRDVEAYHR